MPGSSDASPSSQASRTSSDQLLQDILQEELPIQSSDNEKRRGPISQRPEESEGRDKQSGIMGNVSSEGRSSAQILHQYPCRPQVQPRLQEAGGPLDGAAVRVGEDASSVALVPPVGSLDIRASLLVPPPPADELPQRSSSLSFPVPRSDDATLMSDAPTIEDLQRQLARSQSRCHELEHAEKIQGADISSLRASNMALRAEVSSGKRQVAMSDEEVRSLRKRLDATTRVLEDLKAANMALTAQNSILMHGKSEHADDASREDTRQREVATRQTGMQTESLVNEHSTQNKVIEDLKKKLVKHEEQELKFERFWPGIEFLDRYAVGLPDSEENGDGGELWMKVLVYLDGRVQELEEENQILKKREERVRHLQRTIVCKIDTATMRTLNELQQQLRIKSDLIESLVKRQAVGSLADADFSRDKSFSSLLIPTTNYNENSDTTSPRQVELACMLAYERDRRRQLEALLEEQISAAASAVAECDSLRASETCYLADFRSLASQVSLLLRQLHTSSVNQRGEEKGRRTRTEAQGAKSADSFTVLCRACLRALQSLQKQLSRLVQRVNGRGFTPIGSSLSFPSAGSRSSLFGSQSSSTRPSYAVSRSVARPSLTGSRGSHDLSVLQGESKKPTSPSPVRLQRSTIGGIPYRQSWSSASELFRTS